MQEQIEGEEEGLKLANEDGKVRAATEEEENPFAEDKKEEEKTTPLKGEDLGQEKGNYKGFDKYAKFVEFEEKMFKVEEVADEELM